MSGAQTELQYTVDSECDISMHSQYRSSARDTHCGVYMCRLEATVSPLSLFVPLCDCPAPSAVLRTVRNKKDSKVSNVYVCV